MEIVKYGKMRKRLTMEVNDAKWRLQRILKCQSGQFKNIRNNGDT